MAKALTIQDTSYTFVQGPNPNSVSGTSQMKSGVLCMSELTGVVR